MGWTHPYGGTKKSVCDELINGSGHNTWHVKGERLGEVEYTGRVHAHCLRGNVLWIVRGRFNKAGVETERWIECNLLRVAQGDWGYKDMDESVHPYYYTCPLSYLDLVKDFPPVNKSAEEWREKVREHWAGVKTIKLTDGMKMKVVKGGWKCMGITLLGMEYTLIKNGRAWRVKFENGLASRLPRKMLQDSEAVGGLPQE